MTTATKPAIRRDLFSVKVKGNGFNHWCHERMFRSRTSARRFKAGLRPMNGYTLQAKIVHPALTEAEARALGPVDVYVAAGNTIED